MPYFINFSCNSSVFFSALATFSSCTVCECLKVASGYLYQSSFLSVWHQNFHWWDFISFSVASQILLWIFLSLMVSIVLLRYWRYGSFKISFRHIEGFIAIIINCPSYKIGSTLNTDTSEKNFKVRIFRERKQWSLPW